MRRSPRDRAIHLREFPVEKRRALPAFPNPWMANPFVGSAPRRLHASRTVMTPPRVRPAVLRSPRSAAACPHHPGVMAAGDRFILVHHPGHCLRDSYTRTGCGDVPVDADHRGDSPDVCPREVLQLDAVTSIFRIAADHHPLGYLRVGGPQPRSSTSSRRASALDRIHGLIRMEADPPLCRAPRVVTILYPVCMVSLSILPVSPS